MQNVVVGVFESGIKAQEAVLALRNNGFNSDNIDISDNDRSGTEISNPSEQESGISRFFKNLFGDTDEASSYSQVAQKGTMVTVYTDSRGEAELASDILDQHGAINANQRGMLNREDEISGKERRANSDTSNLKERERLSEEEIERERDRKTKEPQASKEVTSSIPVVEENMEVGKRTLETDRVRIRSRIIEKPVEELVRLRQEHISIQRVPVNRAATNADLRTFKEGTIEASEMEEVPVVKKEAKVVEEVKIKKEVTEKGEKIRGSVKKQDIDVERQRKDRERNPDESNL